MSLVRIRDDTEVNLVLLAIKAKCLTYDVGLPYFIHALKDVHEFT